MTIDVEDYFQVSAFETAVKRESWSHRSLRIESNVERILTLLDEYEVKATFFTLGWVAEKCPSMIKKMAAQGHEVASHGWEHVRVVNHGPKEFEDDIKRTKKVLEDVSGTPVNGYRAASYSIGSSTPWAHDVLADSGYRYSSSIAPIKHDLYGMPDAPRFRFATAGGRLFEVPISTISVVGRQINCSGGGWFRLFPYWFSKYALRKINTVERESGVFYFHPWEIDPEQPRVDGITTKTRVRHYLNLKRTEPRLRRLLSDFSWGRMDEVFFSSDERANW